MVLKYIMENVQYYKYGIMPILLLIVSYNNAPVVLLLSTYFWDAVFVKCIVEIQKFYFEPPEFFLLCK